MTKIIIAVECKERKHMKEEEKIILQLASTIADLQRKADEAQSNLELWRDECRSREKAEQRIKELISAHGRLLAEFNRALEVIRGAGLEFQSDIIVSEYQEGTVCEISSDNHTALHHPFIASRFLTVK